MDKKHYMPLLFIFSLLVLILVILLACTNDWINAQSAVQQKLIEAVFSPKINTNILNLTEKNYKTYFIESGQKEALQHFFIPSIQEKNASKGLETLATGYFHWVHDKTEILYSVLKMILYKLNFLNFYAPWFLALYGALSIEGELNRRGKEYSFELPSALRFGLAVKGKVIVGFIVSYLLILPYGWSLIALLFLLLLFTLLGYLLCSNAHYQ